MNPVKEWIIVGAGIAGLTVAEGLLNRGDTVTLLERYPNVGGRIVTHRDAGLQYEIGAGRIFHTHKRVRNLIQRFRLHTFPIASHMTWRSQNTKHSISNPFLESFAPIVTSLLSFPHRTLASHTIAELIPDTWRPLLHQYPYWAELHLMRADIALDSFLQMNEMGTNEGYVGIVEGIDTLTTKLRDSVLRKGGTILTRYRVENIRAYKDGYIVSGSFGKKSEAKPFVLQTQNLILATCRCSLGTFHVLHGHPILQQLQTSPLTRIYAVYPPAPGRRRVWFKDLPKTVTDSPLRYIIPIDPQKGLIMISYTDGADTDYWRDLDGSALQSAIQQEVRTLFEDEYGPIPEPTYLQKHEWPSGCTYWVPTSSKYSIDVAIKRAMNPRKGLYIVGESVSQHQAWIEGALESAEKLLTQI